MNLVNFIKNPLRQSEAERLLSCKEFTLKKAHDVLSYHQTIPSYQATKLHSLSGLSRELNISKLWLKDESSRFGLKAFKGLGASYAFSQILSEVLGQKITSFSQLAEPANQQKIKSLTFVTTTDGNHGKGVAWFAKMLGCKAYVFMPKGSAEERFLAIKEQGAIVEITDLSYDDCTEYTENLAKENDWVLVQDSAWPGYEEIPLQIMQGYLTLMAEIFESMEEGEIPTHVFAQCGVGSFTAVVQAYLINKFGEKTPKFIVVEPTKADCCFQSVKYETLTKLTNSLDTIMAGLACGKPSLTAWDILSKCSEYFVSCEDEITKIGMKTLASPKGEDEPIVSGDSGAVGIGLIKYLMSPGEENEKLRKEMELDQNSKVLCFSTEGMTNQSLYQEVVNS